MASICEHSFLACTAIALVPVVITPRSRRTVDVPSCWRALHGGRFFQFAVTQNDIGLASQRLDAGLLSMAVIALLVGRRVIPFFAKRVVDGLKISLYESSAAWPWAARNRPRPWLL